MPSGCDTEREQQLEDVFKIVEEVIATLPEKVQARCNRTALKHVVDRFNCLAPEHLLQAVWRDDSRAAFKEAAPVILLAKLSAKLTPYDIDADASGLPPGGELLLHEPLPEVARASKRMRSSTRVATFDFAIAATGQEKLRPPRLIRGKPPPAEALCAMSPLYSCEYEIYPAAFLQALGLQQVLFCTGLSYDGQQRRDVPDMVGGTLYIDVADRHARRSRHAFHHELWHMADFQLRGPAFEGPEAEWEALNPPEFTYGFGGRFMRQSGTADPPSAPSDHFINAYSTSSIAEDKAEVWAALMCYQHVLKSKTLKAKAALLKRRARQMCPAIDDAWWRLVRWHQCTLNKEWEECAAGASRTFWHSWVTGMQSPIRPLARVEVADLRELLTRAGLSEQTARFDTDGYEDLGFIHSLDPEEQLSVLGGDLGLDVEDAARLLSILDTLLPISSAPMPRCDDIDIEL